MTVAARDDVHRPSAIQPEHYEYVAMETIKLEGLGDAQFILAERERIRAHMAKTGGSYSRHAHGGNCGICGNVNAIYTALFYHALSNTYLHVGRGCCEKLGLGADADFNAFTARVHDATAARAGKKKAQLLLEAAGLGESWRIFAMVRANQDAAANGTPWDSDKLGQEEWTTVDIVEKLVKYGSISEKQELFLHGLLERINTRDERMAERAAEREAAEPAPTGRVEVRGTVLKVETRQTDFGPVTKMTVKTAAGWILWSTMPAGCGAKRGESIAIRVTVTPSDKDPKFAFGKRPTLIAEAQ